MGGSKEEREKIPSSKLGSSMQIKGNGRTSSAKHKIFQSSHLGNMMVEHTGKTTRCSAKIDNIEI